MKRVLCVALMGLVVSLVGCGKSKEEQQREADKKLIGNTTVQKVPQKEY